MNTKGNRRETCNSSTHEISTGEVVEMRKSPWERVGHPVLSREEWDCLADEVTWKDYKGAPNNIIWTWSIRKRLLRGASRYSRSNRIQMLKQQDWKSSREVVKDPTSNNFTLQ